MVFAMVAGTPAGRRRRMHARFAAEVNFHLSITTLERCVCVPYIDQLRSESPQSPPPRHTHTPTQAHRHTGTHARMHACTHTRTCSTSAWSHRRPLHRTIVASSPPAPYHRRIVAPCTVPSRHGVVASSHPAAGRCRGANHHACDLSPIAESHAPAIRVSQTCAVLGSNACSFEHCARAAVTSSTLEACANAEAGPAGVLVGDLTTLTCLHAYPRWPW